MLIEEQACGVIVVAAAQILICGIKPPQTGGFFITTPHSYIIAPTVGNLEVSRK